MSTKREAEGRRQKNRELEIKTSETELKFLLLKSARGTIGNVCTTDFFSPSVDRHAISYSLHEDSHINCGFNLLYFDARLYVDTLILRLPV